MFSPWITPAVAVSIVWIWIFEPDTGLANYLLGQVGLAGLPWLHSSSTALASVALVTIWKNLGYVIILFTGSLSRIPTELYEAASTDGAGALKRFLRITLPLLRRFCFYVGCGSSNQSKDVIKDGTLYAIPAYGTTQVMYYNRSLFEKAGIEPDSIKAWQDLETAAKTIHDKTGGVSYG